MSQPAQTPDVLRRILASKREELAILSDAYREEVRTRAQDAPPTRSLREALTSAPGMAVIAEVKRRSPSRGDLKPGVEADQVARAYEAAGASAVSVLTNMPFFGGSLDDLAGVRRAVGLPVLRKDFILEPVQLHEARAHGADAVLLMASVLGPARMADLHGKAEELGLEALVEVHSLAELRAVASMRPGVLGVNNRDLHTLTVDLATSESLALHAPEGSCLVAESGVAVRADVERLERAGFQAVLVGTSLMLAPDPGALLQELTGTK